MIDYVFGDATQPQGDGKKIIVHVCNDAGGWGKGFVLALSARWTLPETKYRQWYADGGGFALGNVDYVTVERGTIIVANMIAQHGVHDAAGPPVRYRALEQCLTKVAAEALRIGASVHMPRIGCGLGGGQWEDVEPIINSTLIAAGVAVTVYDWLGD